MLTASQGRLLRSEPKVPKRRATGRQEIARLERELRTLFERYEELLRESEPGSEIRSDISKFVCVRICGFVEQTLMRLTVDHASTRAAPTIQSFVGAAMTRVRSPRRENLIAFASRFGDGWGEELLDFLQAEDPDGSLNSLVQTRNDIAHGLSTGVGHDTLGRYLELATAIAEWFTIRLDPPGAAA